ncbi:MAG: hypothetical protein II937_12990 [Bacteroidales bacterium]|nr:hypothetical protein [Bacteroidales bacterium]
MINIFKLTNFLAKGDKGMFDVTVDSQRAFFETLKKPIDNFDRTKKQYLCQMFFVPLWKRILFEIVSLIVLPFYWLIALIRSLFVSKRLLYKVDCISEYKSMEEVLPSEFRSKYQYSFQEWYSGKMFTFNDWIFCLKCLFRTFSPYLTLKVSVKISLYSYMIHRYKPNAIQVCAEYSFTSSVLTEYCNSFGIKHINVMHGEKLYYIRDTFFHFDECYIWHEHYKQLFMELGAEESQFVIAVPPSLTIDCEKNYSKESFADYKYYLGEETEEEIHSIVNSMQKLVNNGETIKYRPHPRYTNMSVLKKYVSLEDIEDTKKVPIVESIASSNFVIGSFTTVLLQAYFSKKNVVLDDVTFKKRYVDLKSRHYFLADKECSLLSNFLK